jgi:Sulfotransferase family
VHEPPQHVVRAAVVLDDFQLVYVPVPKAGSTAVLSALAEVVGLREEDFAASRKLEATRSLAVHDGSIWGPRYRLEGRTSSELDRILDSDEWLRVTVVREPVRRLWSAWVSKVLIRDPRFVAVFGEDWFPASPKTANDVVSAFRRFVLALPEAHRHDPHWLPQSGLIGVGQIAYDHIGRVENLDRTAAVLDERLRLHGQVLPPLRRENSGILPFSPGVFDRDSHEVCARWTEPDRAAFGYEILAPSVEEPDERWRAAVDAAIPAVQAVIDRNERIRDLTAILESARSS